MLAPLCKRTLAAIATTLPTEEGYRHRSLFRLAQRLKAVSQYANAELSELRSVVTEWHRQALPVIGTKDFVETWADFANAWVNVKYPAGQEPIRKFLEAAMEKPLPPAADNYIGSPAMQRLVAFCFELQLMAGDEPFYLSCRVAGELLGISHTQANSWLNLLVMENVLRVVTPGTRNRATEYRYIG